jgi:hypothetical protein
MGRLGTIFILLGALIAFGPLVTASFTLPPLIETAVNVPVSQIFFLIELLPLPKFLTITPQTFEAFIFGCILIAIGFDTLITIKREIVTCEICGFQCPRRRYERVAGCPLCGSDLIR